jgi:hypothetical protein
MRAAIVVAVLASMACGGPGSSSSANGTDAAASNDATGVEGGVHTGDGGGAGDAGVAHDGSIADGAPGDATIADVGAGTEGSTGTDGGCTPSTGLVYDGGTPLGCAPKPSACCYPDDTNTGVPASTPLTASGSLSIQTAGTVVSGLDVSGTVDVYANNVTIRNTRITTSSSGSYALAIRPGVTGTTIEDTTIRGQDNNTNSVEYAVFNISNNAVSVTRANLYNCSECVIGGNVTVTDSYIHDTADPAGAHVENIYGYANTVLRHNTMFNPVAQTAVVYLDPGPTNDCTITDNLMAGGGYTIYGGSSSSQSSSNVVITNNRFARTYYPSSGNYGLDAYFSASGSGDSWSGNYWDDTAAPAGP